MEPVNAIDEIQAKLKKLDEVVKFFTNYDQAPDRMQSLIFDRPGHKKRPETPKILKQAQALV